MIDSQSSNLLPQENLPLIDQPNTSPQKEVRLFISFDLSGCTQFKNQDSEWLSKLNPYFQSFKQRVTVPATHKSAWNELGIQAWKFEGDELLFWMPIQTLDHIKDVVDFTYYTLKNESKTVKELNESLDIKAAVWMALIDGVHNGLYTDETLGWREFMGINIDEGFRVAKTFARSQRLVLSYDVAQALVHSQSGLSSHIVCIGYEKLKGVWGNRAYPALWYSTDDWKDLQKSLIYDLHLECKFTYNLKQEINYADTKFFENINASKPFRTNHYQEILNILSP